MRREGNVRAVRDRHRASRMRLALPRWPSLGWRSCPVFSRAPALGGQRPNVRLAAVPVRRRARSLRRAVGMALACAGGPDVAGPLHAQQLKALAPDPSCGCSIVLHHVTKLGRAEDTIALSARTVVARDTRGYYYAAPVYPPGTVAVMDPSGRLVSTIGRAGRGPGELGAIRHLRVLGDSIIVMDRERLTLYSRDGTENRPTRLPGGFVGFRFAVLPDGRIVLNNYFPTRRSLTVLDRNHTEVRTFGRSVAGQRFPDSDALQATLATWDSGRFVAVHQNHEFLVQIWDTTGRLMNEFRRVPPWFHPWTREDKLSRGPRSPPLPSIIGAYVDRAKSELWIAAIVADRRWQDVAPPEPRGGRREIAGSASIHLSDFPRAYDTIIEVLDLETGRVRISQRFDAYVPYFMEGGLLYGLTEETTGLFVVEVWRAEIVSR